MRDRPVLERRLAWPPVIAAVLLSVTAILVDLAWRTVKISGEALLLCAALVVVLELLAVFAASRLLRRDRRPS